jgi:hypothetical protein
LEKQAIDAPQAQSALVNCDYDQALSLCKSHAGIPFFDGLAATIATEQEALDDASKKFSQGDYSFIEPLKAKVFSTKPRFADLLGKADRERKVLSDLQALQRETNWVAVGSKLADPALTNKPPFQALGEWAKSYMDREEDKQKLEQLNIIFEKMLVWFNVVGPKDPSIRTTEAGKETRRDGEIGTQRDYYLQIVTRLRNEYQKGGWLTKERARRLDKLEENVTHHE